jgi:hypothetical protein
VDGRCLYGIGVAGMYLRSCKYFHATKIKLLWLRQA